ncbi:hypothetical protein AVEN_83879-1 [Araneus ventricosus]|uniref:Uncharacterized protein n=1 Tax=Araneus ventricosus TaxID=182803 RepID=A0A4Y2FUC1_ARAVE|nr:hypothetical protein AVEN_83879-1 [Araneus ventricosus]
MLNSRPSRLTWRLGHLQNNHCNSSDTKVGVLTTMTGHVPSLPAGGTHVIDDGSAPNINVPTSRSENPFIYPATSHSCTRDASRWEKSKKKCLKTANFIHVGTFRKLRFLKLESFVL